LDVGEVISALVETAGGVASAFRLEASLTEAAGVGTSTPVALKKLLMSFLAAKAKIVGRDRTAASSFGEATAVATFEQDGTNT